LRLGSVWCPEKQGVERLHVPAGQSLQTWIDPDKEYDLAELESRCDAEGSIGSLILHVNDLEADLLV
jgi:hypothetical protein